MGDERRRTSDQTPMRMAANIATQTAKQTSQTFWDWTEKRKVAAHAVIAVTLWLTITVIEWAMDFADTHATRDSNSIGVIIGAVLTPWGLMQGAMFKFYIDLLKANDVK